MASAQDAETEGGNAQGTPTDSELTTDEGREETVDAELGDLADHRLQDMNSDSSDTGTLDLSDYDANDQSEGDVQDEKAHISRKTLSLDGNVDELFDEIDRCAARDLNRVIFLLLLLGCLALWVGSERPAFSSLSLSLVRTGTRRER